MGDIQAQIELQGIETRFGSVFVHRGISLELYPGSVVALIGGSGSGKSVLLRTIIGLHKPSAGTVRVFGEDIWTIGGRELDRIRNRFGVLFQNGALFSGLTVAQNVAVPLKEQTTLRDEVISEIVELRLALAGLPITAGSKMPSELSGGMRKRAALARALALEPEIVFLDEPTSGLDPITAHAFDGMIRTLCDSLGMAIVMATHDLETLFSVVDRVIVLADGLLIADGPVAEVSKMNHPWVREYFSRTA
jgi:phospholipid/cholesterol/gamma-HCH transport system ATP-binding protein